MNVWHQACDVQAISRVSLCFSRLKIETTGGDSLRKTVEQASCSLVQPVVSISTSVLVCVTTVSQGILKQDQTSAGIFIGLIRYQLEQRWLHQESVVINMTWPGQQHRVHQKWICSFWNQYGMNESFPIWQTRNKVDSKSEVIKNNRYDSNRNQNDSMKNRYDSFRNQSESSKICMGHWWINLTP